MRRVLFALAGALLLAGALRADADGPSELKLAVIVTRHGVRPPLVANKDIALYSADPWPQWSAPPSYLTPHGRRQMVLMGAYYRELYTREGLLTGRPEEDGRSLHVYADSDQRTIETGRALAEGLAPGAAVTIHSKAQGQPDALFTPTKLKLGGPSLAMGRAALLGRIGGDVQSIVTAEAPNFELLERILFGGDGTPPPGKVALLRMPWDARPGKAEVIDFDGPLHKAENLTDDLLLEYAEGMPMAQVGWGRMSRADLTRLLELHARYFDLTQRTFYMAQAQSSNLASHILDAMEQAVDPPAGRSQAAGPRMIVLVGHDTNQANLSGLLSLEWQLPGTQPDPMLPGGALVFELRRHGGSGGWFVRAFYVSQSLEQTRELAALSLRSPPQTAPIFIPGCSGEEAGFEAPLEKFAALVRRRIDPRYVAPEGF
ncbi:MAG TPA: histidine-type phosphatase [Opitutaceae bacterium]|nr:histidine-type phosphatase [Opitutaceae bacterium]